MEPMTAFLFTQTRFSPSRKHCAEAQRAKRSGSIEVEFCGTSMVRLARITTRNSSQGSSLALSMTHSKGGGRASYNRRRFDENPSRQRAGFLGGRDACFAAAPTLSRLTEPQSVNRNRLEEAQRTVDHTELMHRLRNRRTIARGIGFLLIGPFAVHILATRATRTREWLAVAVLAVGVVVVLLWSLRGSFVWKLPRSVWKTPPRWFELLERRVEPVANRDTGHPTDCRNSQ